MDVKGILKSDLVPADEPAVPEQRPFGSIFRRSPGINPPTQAKLVMLKREWANDWDTVDEGFASEVQQATTAK